MEKVIKRKRPFFCLKKDKSVFKSGDPTKFYTTSEEIFNSITHGLGSFAAIIGTTLLVINSLMFANTTSVVVSLIYGVSLFILYTMSTLYHAFTNPQLKKVFRIFDHTSIYVLIAGSYTPIAVIALSYTPKGAMLCIAVWIMAILGIVLSCISLSKFKAITMSLYVLMGWTVVFAFSDIIATLEPAAFWLLLAGGICYTGGILFYAQKSIKYMHGIWHLFVLAGSILQFFCIYLYILPMSYV